MPVPPRALHGRYLWSFTASHGEPKLLLKGSVLPESSCGWPSCARCICHRTRPVARAMWPSSLDRYGIQVQRSFLRPQGVPVVATAARHLRYCPTPNKTETEVKITNADPGGKPATPVNNQGQSHS
jgi:hypothetical protein